MTIYTLCGTQGRAQAELQYGMALQNVSVNTDLERDPFAQQHAHLHSFGILEAQGTIGSGTNQQQLSQGSESTLKTAGMRSGGQSPHGGKHTALHSSLNAAASKMRDSTRVR